MWTHKFEMLLKGVLKVLPLYSSDYNPVEPTFIVLFTKHGFDVIFMTTGQPLMPILVNFFRWAVYLKEVNEIVCSVSGSIARGNMAYVCKYD